MRRVPAIVSVLALSAGALACGGQSDHPPTGASPASDDASSPTVDGSTVVSVPPGEDSGAVVTPDDDAGIILSIDGSTSFEDAPPPPTDGSASQDSSTSDDSGTHAEDSGAHTLDSGADAGVADAGTDAALTCTATGYHLCVSDAGSVCADDNSPETCGTSCSPCPMPANGVSSCNAGTCAYSCDNGYVTCSTGCCSCGDTQNDPNNCGACGHVCTGGESCNSGICGAVVVASGQANAYAIAADDENVYWTTTGVSASILQAPVGGGGATVLVTSANAYPASLAVSLGQVYWADAEGDTINRVPVGGGTNVPIAGGLNEPMTVLISGSEIYVALAPYGATGGIGYVPLGGGSLTSLATGQQLSNPPSIAVGSTVYWTTETDVMTYGATGATPFVTDTYPYAVATDGANVYWASGLSNGAILQRSAAGGATITLATNQYYPNAIAVDATNVYWTTGQGGAGTVMSAPIGGAGTPVTIASNQSYPAAMALNSTHIFWVNFGDGSIVSAPK
jgi:hypothetical protein